MVGRPLVVDFCNAATHWQYIATLQGSTKPFTEKNDMLGTEIFHFCNIRSGVVVY